MKSPMTCTFLLAGALAAGVLTAGCAATATAAADRSAAAGPARTAAEGRLAGRFVMEGGPMRPDGKQPGTRPISGTVTFTAAGRPPVSVTAGLSGTFSALLPPGRYHVWGRSPAIMTVDGSGHSHEDRCSQPASATVTAGHTVTITLACIVP
ncbi:MAG TPA: hypothetical protein VGI96_21275 [Streptosporangiaceae bacterium]|jgi:hypothetical protein